MAHRRLCKASSILSILVLLFVSISVVSCDIQFTRGTAIQEVFEDELVNDDVSLHPTESSKVTIRLIPDASVPETSLKYEVLIYRTMTNSNTLYRTVEVGSTYTLDLHDIPRASYRLEGRAVRVDGVVVAIGEASMKVSSNGTEAVMELKDVGHIMERHEKIDATCTEPGTIEHWHCTRCGLDFTDEEGLNHVSDTTIPAKGHSTVHVGYKAPSCTEAGTIDHWRCDRCEKDFMDEEGSSETTSEDIAIPSLGHDWSTKWSHDEHIHWHICTRCSTTGDVADHAMEVMDRRDATDDEAGYIAYKCSICGFERKDTIPPINHNWVEVSKKEPTCLEEGYIDYRCSDCGKEYREVLAKVPHSTTHVEAVAAMCTEPGNHEYWYCSKCGFYYKNEACSAKFEDKDKTVIVALGHDWPATWKNDSDSHWRTCKRQGCGEVEKRAHSYDQQKETAEYRVSDATCTKAAVYNYSCVCGAKGTDTFESTTDTAKGHELEYVPANAATCGVAGNKEYWKCTRANCGKLFSDAEGKNEISLDDVTIPATGEHVFRNSANPKGMFAVYDDYHVSICLVCDKEITDTKEVHTDGYRSNSSYHWRACAVCPKEWLETKAPHEYDIEGAGSHYCVCGEKEPDTPSSSGFEVSEDVSEPEGSIKAEKLGEGVWRFTIEDRNPGDSKKSIDTSRIRWFVDDSEVSDAFGSIVFNLKTTRLESYRVLCVFANDSGYGSEEAMVKGY